MRTKLMLLSALTCLAGGTTLLRPASAQDPYPPCSSLAGTYCSGGWTRCTLDGGGFEHLECLNGTWHWV